MNYTHIERDYLILIITLLLWLKKKTDAQRGYITFPGIHSKVTAPTSRNEAS